MRKSWLTVTAIGAGALVAGATLVGAQETPVPRERVVSEELRGILDKVGNDHFVGDAQADFGPFWYRDETKATQDYDGDGITETITEELDGLAGTEVTLEVEPPGRGGDLDVLTINGQVYRVPDSGPPPWAGPPPWVLGPAAGVPAGPPPFVGDDSK
ncbi:MAG: hypothetical protein ACRD02_06815 [Acidimicrobiia bacterium]